MKIHSKSLKFLLDMQRFCKLSLVLLGIRPRLRRCAERTRQGAGRRSRPPKAALEQSYIRPRIPVSRIAYFGGDKNKVLTKSLTPKEDSFRFLCGVCVECVPNAPHGKYRTAEMQTFQRNAEERGVPDEGNK